MPLDSTQPVPASGTGILSEAADSQRRRILSAAASLRLTGSVLFLIVSVILWKGSPPLR